MEEFKPGETVQLKSGGPLMTVSHAESNGYWRCEWFDDQNQHQHKAFLGTSLTRRDTGAIGV
jgi:uncharacterized protein YodC (DUF2158 family)